MDNDENERKSEETEESLILTIQSQSKRKRTKADDSYFFVSRLLETFKKITSFRNSPYISSNS